MTTKSFNVSLRDQWHIFFRQVFHCPEIMLVCHKVTHKKLTSDSPTISNYLYGSRPIHITGLILP